MKNIIKYLLSILIVLGLSYLFASVPVVARPGEEVSSGNDPGAYPEHGTMEVMDSHTGYMCSGKGITYWYDKWRYTHISFMSSGPGLPISNGGATPGDSMYISFFVWACGNNPESLNPTITTKFWVDPAFNDGLPQSILAQIGNTEISTTDAVKNFNSSKKLIFHCTSKTYYKASGAGGGSNNAMAYVLAETDYGTANHSASYVQAAFWDALGQGGGDSSGLYSEAVVFERMHSRINGNYGNTVNDLTNLNNVKVEYDATNQKYRVGPFKIKYEQVVYNGKVMAGISQTPTLTVNINGNSSVIAYGTDWKFSTKGIPDSEEAFYIIINYKEGLNAIESMKFNFKYLNAQGSYTKFDGKVGIYTLQVIFSQTMCKYTKCDGAGFDTKSKHKSPQKHYHSDNDSSCDNYKCKGHSYTTTTHYYCSTCGYHSSINNHSAECAGTITTHNSCTWAGDWCSCSGSHTHYHSDNSSSCSNYKCKGHECKGGKPCNANHEAAGFGWENHVSELRAELSAISENKDGPEIQPVAEVHGGSRWYEYSSKTMNWRIDLTTTLAGTVWLDFEPDKTNNTVDGTKNTGESGVQNVEVRVYRYKYNGSGVATREDLAIIHKPDGSKDSWPKFTNTSGKYEIKGLEAPGNSSRKGTLFYVVEFRYDGQVYESTVYLQGMNGSNVVDDTSKNYVDFYKNNSNIDNNKYFSKSMAVEEVDERWKFDKSFGKITGDSGIESNLATKGVSITVTDNNKTVNNNGNGEIRYNGKSENGMITSSFDSAATDNHESMKGNWSNNNYYKRFTMNASTYYDNTDLHGHNVNPNEYRIVYPAGDYTGTVKYIMNNKKGSSTIGNGDIQYIGKYMLNINLGLQQRKETDVSVLKDIYKINVVVNEQEMVQEFNIYGEKDKSDYNTLKIQLDSNKQKGYTLGLYNSDVKYNQKSRYKKAIDRINEIKEGTELRVFVTYAIRVYNNSDMSDITINEITDYYDKTYTLIDSQNDKMYGYETDKADKGIYSSIVTEDMRREKKCTADTPYYRVLSSLDDNIDWKATKKENLSAGTGSKGDFEWEIVDSKADAYNTFCTRNKDLYGGMNKAVSSSLNNVKLKVNEYAEIFTTYEIDYKGFVEMKNSAEPDIAKRVDLVKEKAEENLQKNNIAEVSNYSTYYSEKDVQRNGSGIQYYKPYKQDWISGKIDKDSAPNNIQVNDISRDSLYEDDTCRAVPLKIAIETYEREMYGYVFEDNKNKNSDIVLNDGNKLQIGDGCYVNDDDDLIPNVQVSLYEVINLDDAEEADSPYTNLEYYYEVPRDYYGGDTETRDKNSVNKANKEVKGNYCLYDFLAGDYVLRFDYGTKSDSKGTIYSTNTDGSIKEDKDVEIIKYNGQDYENTSFLSKDGYKALNDKYLNLRKEDVNGIEAIIEQDNAQAYSVARDNESRRMVVDSYSRTIENTRGEILRDRKASLSDDNYKYIEATKMFAETPIMQIEVYEPKQLNEDTNIEAGQKIKVTKSTSEVSKNDITKHKYSISNINFGLEERAKTDIKVEQYIEQIILKKDNEEIFRVKMDETGEIIRDNNTIHPDKLTYMTNKSTGPGQQGFYGISIEDDYLNGLTMKVKYKINIMNESEVDYTGRLADCYVASEIIDKATYPPTTEALEEKTQAILGKKKTVLSESVSMNSTLAEILKLHGGVSALNNLLSTHRGEIKTNGSGRMSVNDTIRPDTIVYGGYVGRFYYENKKGGNDSYTIKNYRKDDMPDVTISYDEDKIVKTTVDQLIDYIDVNTSYDLDTQGSENMDWNLSGNISATGSRETIPSLQELVSEYSYRTIGVSNIYDNKDNALVTDISSNIAISTNERIEKTEAMAGEGKAKPENTEYSTYLDNTINENWVEYRADYKNVQVNNSKMKKELEPKNIANDEKDYMTSMWINTSKVTASDTDSNNMLLDNLVEVLVYSNPTGRRDINSVPGNAMARGTTKGFWKAGYNSIKGTATGNLTDEERANWIEYPENDAFAPEYVTIMAPTGIAVREYIKNMILPIIILIVAMIGMAGVFGYKQYSIRKKYHE